MAESRKKDERNSVQGEGDYRSAREFNEKQREFVKSHDTEELAEKAKPASPEQAAELERAERAAKSHARPDPEEESNGDDDSSAGKPKPPKP
jgi:hypothetical protein